MDTRADQWSEEIKSRKGVLSKGEGDTDSKDTAGAAGAKSASAGDEKLDKTKEKANRGAKEEEFKTSVTDFVSKNVDKYAHERADAAKEQFKNRLVEMANVAKDYALMVSLGRSGNKAVFATRVAAEAHPFILHEAASAMSEGQKMDVSEYFQKAGIKNILNALIREGLPYRASFKSANATDGKTGGKIVAYVLEPTDMLDDKQIERALQVIRESGIVPGGVNTSESTNMDDLERDIIDNVGGLDLEGALSSVIGVSDGKLSYGNTQIEETNSTNDALFNVLSEKAKHNFKLEGNKLTVSNKSDGAIVRDFELNDGEVKLAQKFMSEAVVDEAKKTDEVEEDFHTKKSSRKRGKKNKDKDAAKNEVIKETLKGSDAINDKLNRDEKPS